MANETIGKLLHHCDHDADVRKDKNGRLYLNCPHCGQLKYNLQGGQNYILENTRMFGAGGEPVQRNVTNVNEESAQHDVTSVNVDKGKGCFLDSLEQEGTV